MKYRKKPVVVEAHQWFMNGDHPQDHATTHDRLLNTEGAVVRHFGEPEVDGDKLCQRCTLPIRFHGWIDTLEGGHIVCPGDYIITGVQGERYPCKPDIFRATYDPVEE